MAVFLLDTLGSIASRQFNFNYGILSPLSMLLYGLVGAWTAQVSGFYTGIAAAMLVALFDGTVGWKISMVLEANIGEAAKSDNTALEWNTVVLTVLFGLICGALGAYFWG